MFMHFSSVVNEKAGSAMDTTEDKTDNTNANSKKKSPKKGKKTGSGGKVDMDQKSNDVLVYPLMRSGSAFVLSDVYVLLFDLN